MLGMSRTNGADTRPGRSSFRPRHWARAQAENPLARFIPFSSLVSPHDVITRGGDYLRVWRLDGVAFGGARERIDMQGNTGIAAALAPPHPFAVGGRHQGGFGEVFLSPGPATGERQHPLDHVLSAGVVLAHRRVQRRDIG